MCVFPFAQPVGAGLVDRQTRTAVVPIDKALAKFEALVLDDTGYVQQSREEMEVLFNLPAERYETGSVTITSNVAFSQWERIF